jgi:hypothetical protein
MPIRATVLSRPPRPRTSTRFQLRCSQKRFALPLAYFRARLRLRGQARAAARFPGASGLWSPHSRLRAMKARGRSTRVLLAYVFVKESRTSATTDAARRPVVITYSTFASNTNFSFTMIYFKHIISATYLSNATISQQSKQPGSRNIKNYCHVYNQLQSSCTILSERKWKRHVQMRRKRTCNRIPGHVHAP